MQPPAKPLIVYLMMSPPMTSPLRKPFQSWDIKTLHCYQNPMEIYDTKLISKKYEPDPLTLTPPSYPEVLKPLILLQHEAFTSIMWAGIHIQLLILDQCADFLSKALKILDGLISYSQEIIGAPNWPSIPNNNFPLLLLKLYLSNTIFNT